jgi:acyl-CoA thioester hydrolase
MLQSQSSKPKSSRFRYYLRVRYHECDTQRVVFNGNYGTFVDMALTEFLTALLPDRHSHAGHVVDGAVLEFQLVRQVIEWTAPARFNDVVEIAAWCERVGTTSFVMRYELRKPGEDQPFVTAETVNVVMDGRTWTKMAVGPELREKLLAGAPGVQIDHAGYLARAGR